MKYISNEMLFVVITITTMTSCGGGGNPSDNKPSVPNQQIISINTPGIYQGRLSSKSSGTIDLDVGIILKNGEFMLHSNPAIATYPNMLLVGTFQISDNMFSGNGQAYSCTGVNFPTGNNIESWSASDGKITQAGNQVQLNSNYTSSVPDTGILNLYTTQPLADPAKTLKKLSGPWIASATSTIGYISVAIDETGTILGDLTGDVIPIEAGNNGFRIKLGYGGQSYSGLGFAVDATDTNQFFYMLTNNPSGQLSIGLYRPAPSVSYPSTYTATAGASLSIIPTNTGGPITHAGITNGTMPSGLSINNDGSIRGVPTTIGSYRITVSTWNATGSGGNSIIDFIIKQ